MLEGDKREEQYLLPFFMVEGVPFTQTWFVEYERDQYINLIRQQTSYFSQEYVTKPWVTQT